MKELVNNIIECEIDNIPFDDFTADERFGLIVYKNNVKYEFLIDIKSISHDLICLGSGALNGIDLEKFKKHPRFHRQSWKFSQSTIFYNDPTRYLNDSILGGWGIGTPDDWYLDNIKEIILKIAEFINVKNENILFYGSSLGGFMSILLGTMVKDSKVLADVPQLTFENAKYFKNIKSTVFPNLSDEEIKNNYNYRLNVLDLIRKEKYIPNAYLIFDASEIDINEHYIHFFRDLNKITECENSNKMKIIINPIDEHKFLNMEESLEIIQQACDNNLLCFDEELYSSEVYKDLKLLEKELKKTVIDKNSQIDTLKKQKEEILITKNIEIQKINSKNKELERKFDEISNSTTWRMTKPLRTILDFFKK